MTDQRITRQSGGDERYDAAALAIRKGLLASKGSQRCTQPGCAVITQAGTEGHRQHLAVVHEIGTEIPR